VNEHIPLPGKLGDPSLNLETDPRTDPRIVAAFGRLGLSGDGAMPENLPIPKEMIPAALCEMESMQTAMLNAVGTTVPVPADIAYRTHLIQGAQGNDITLHIHSPAKLEGQVPGVIHLHGGGMAILKAADKFNIHLRSHIAALGVVVIGVEFRNSAGSLGCHPFPAGLNDCSAGLHWVYDNKEQLNISNIVLAGESGGGNLALATCLKAKEEGVVEKIDGVYAMCPYIFRSGDTAPDTLVSKRENLGYFLDESLMAAIAYMYDPLTENSLNPLCWPYFVDDEQLVGLPPHVVSVNELDPLRDEGLSYYRKLIRAKVPATSRTVNATTHAADLMFPADLPEAFNATLQDLVCFAKSLQKS